MKKQQAPSGKYADVWGDTVAINELVISCFIGTILSLGLYIVGTKIFEKVKGLDPGLQKGYALLVGVGGCILAAIICAKLFKPKREIVRQFEDVNIEHILEKNGMTLQEEAQALAEAHPDVIKELEDLQLWALLTLIPENSPHYKSEYAINAQKGANQ